MSDILFDKKRKEAINLLKMGYLEELKKAMDSRDQKKIQEFCYKITDLDVQETKFLADRKKYREESND